MTSVVLQQQPSVLAAYRKGIGHISVYRPTIDPQVLMGIAALTAVVGLAASFVPGRRAALMDPLVALRHE